MALEDEGETHLPNSGLGEMLMRMASMSGDDGLFGRYGMEIDKASHAVYSYDKFATGPRVKVDITKRTQAAFDYFKSVGWSPEQSAGLVGNLIQESGLRTQALGDSGLSEGLGQWNHQRRANLHQFVNAKIAEQTKLNPNFKMNDDELFKFELQYVNHELRNGTEKAAGHALASAKTAGEAGAIVSSRYERPLATVHEMQLRAGIARTVLSKVNPEIAPASDAVAQLDNKLPNQPDYGAAKAKDASAIAQQLYDNDNIVKPVATNDDAPKPSVKSDDKEKLEAAKATGKPPLSKLQIAVKNDAFAGPTPFRLPGSIG